MSRRPSLSFVLSALLVLAVADTLAPARAQAAPALLKTASAQILVTGHGMTLYLFTPDKPTKSVCTGTCATFWPPLLLAKGMKAPSALPGIRGTFGVAARAGGARQLTYDGAPLYTFTKDKKPGDMTGQGGGGTWWTVVVGGAETPRRAAASALVKEARAPILVTARGMTLYVFAADRCSGRQRQGTRGHRNLDVSARGRSCRGTCERREGEGEGGVE